MEGNIGDFIMWADSPDFTHVSPRLTCYSPGRGYFSDHYNPDGTLQKAMAFDEFIDTGKAAGITDFYYIIGIDAIRAQRKDWQWVIADPLETITRAAAAQARWCREHGIHIWFEIGNECDLASVDSKLKLQPWTAEEYSATAIKISQTIKAQDPQARVGLNGGFKDGWFETVFPLAWRDMDFAVVHAYSIDRNDSIQRFQRALASARLPEDWKANLPLCITETSSYRPGHPISNNLEEATRNFIRIGMDLTTPQVRQVHFWTDRAADCESRSGKNALTMDGDLLPMGQVLAIWNDHLKGNMIGANTDDPDIKVFATQDSKSGPLGIFLVNTGAASKEVFVQVDGSVASSPVDRWSFDGAGPQDPAPIWKKTGQETLADGKMTLMLPHSGFTFIEIRNP